VVLCDSTVHSMKLPQPQLLVASSTAMSNQPVSLPTIIDTERLRLKQVDLEFMEMSLVSRRKASSLVAYKVPENWFDEKQLISLRVSQVKINPLLTSWLLRAIVRRSDNQMIGHINGHGAPGMTHLKPYCEDGIEIGYTIYESYKRQGYASEAICEFVDTIPKPVSVVLAIEVNNSPSLKLATKLGYEKVGQVVEEGETELIYIKRFQ